MTDQATDQVTIIRAKGERLTKKHALGEESEGYGNAYLVTSTVKEVSSIHDLHELLTRLETITDRCVIRGRRRPELPPRAAVRRAYHPDPSKSEPPGFEPADRRWLCVDIDHLACPDHLDPDFDPEGAILYAMEQLPEWLQGVSCHWQWSSSAGLKGWTLLKVHLWFWMDRAVDDPALRVWAKRETYVDHALYNPVQPHYTANPIFAGGLEDPVERRSGLLEGDRHTACVPETIWRWTELEEARRAKARAERAARVVDIRADSPRVRAWVQAQIDGIKSNLEASAGSQRHPAALEAAGSLANTCSWGWLSEQEARAVLDCSPIADLPKRDGELDRLWRWTLARTASNPATPPDLGPDRPPPVRPTPPRRPEPPHPAESAEDHEARQAAGSFARGEGEPPEEPPAPPPHEEEADEAEDYEDDGILWSRDGEGVWWGLEFGARVARHRRDERGRSQVWVYAYHLEPEAHTVDVTTGESGVRLRYRDQSGDWRTTVMASSAWVDKGPARTEAKALADAGAVIMPERGVDLVMQLGRWAMRTRGRRDLVRQVVYLSGWHKTGEGRRAWVNGPHVHGASWLREGDPGPRGKCSGSVESWLKEVGRGATTPGLRFALGVSFAGPMLEPLQMRPFIVHISGSSSAGKSIAGELASSLWGHPEEMELRWQTSPGALAARLERRSGGFAVIDEVQEQEKISVVSGIIHALAGGKEKDRLQRNAELRGRRSWSLTALSTGEIPIAQYLGKRAQGGHSVRAMDVRVTRGELTTSKDHALALRHQTRRHYGCIGDAWGAALCELEEARWDEIRERVYELADREGAVYKEAELGRILPQLAVCVIALGLAGQFGLAPVLSEEELDEALRWAIAKVVEARGTETCPEARAYALLRTLYETQPYRFPEEGSDEQGRDLLGISERGSTGFIFTTRGMLSDEIKQQCSPDVLFEWLQGRGLAHINSASKSGKSRVSGKVRKWWKLNIDSWPEEGEDEDTT